MLPDNHSDSTKVIEQVGAIVEGYAINSTTSARLSVGCCHALNTYLHVLSPSFEGPYGVELLASTHWVAAHQGAVQPERAAEPVRSWSQRKGRIFTVHHVEVALAHLRESGALDEHDLVS